MIFCPVSSPAPRVLVVLAATLSAAGCAGPNYEATPISADATNSAFQARSLRDPGLTRFLTENLHRDFSFPPATWDFETLSWVAFYYHPSLDVARAQWSVMQAAERTVDARPNPTLALTPGYDTSASSPLSPWLPAIAADFLLEPGGQRKRRAAVARQESEAAKQAVFVEAWHVRSQLRQTLITLTFARERADALQQQVELRRDTLATLRARFEAGAIDSTDVTTARLALIAAETAAADAASQLPAARQQVATALGLPIAALDGVELARPALPSMASGDQLATWRETALQSRPDVLAALAHYAAADESLGLEVARQRPDFHLGPGYQWDQGDNKWTLAIAFELPVFNHHEGPIAEAAARRREAAAEFLATQARAIDEIDSAAAAQAGTAAGLTHAQRIRQEVQDADARVQARFHAGAADRLDLQQSRLEVAGAEAAVLDASERAELAAGRLEDALQVPIPQLPALAMQPRALTPELAP